MIYQKALEKQTKKQFNTFKSLNLSNKQIN